MKKPITLFIAAIFILILFHLFYSFAEERITLTTYYPAPYGVYREMRVDRMSVGSVYRNEPLDDGEFIINGTIGIGTTNPQNKLQIHTTTANDHLLITGTAPGIQFSDSEAGTEKAAIGLATAPNHFVFGSSANDLTIRTYTTAGNIIFGMLGGSDIFPVMKITQNGSLYLNQTANIAYAYPRLFIRGEQLKDEATEGFIKLETSGGSPVIRLRIGVKGGAYSILCLDTG